uniref:cilia- and flagella-associated protein 157-like n=1 Tax=Gasterosteus aculeatus aculeatus TaxID=481459 RepID=UPI001A9905E6|nr:cilia- and flagella-associated protein 157-like [Gasterosteus aculeatus aculeatus]
MSKNKSQKSDDKRDEVKKTPKKKSSPTEANKSGSDDKEKDLYLVQIRYLNEQLDWYQLKCEQQERQTQDLSSRYSTLQKEKEDVVDFLKRSVLEKEAEAEQLEQQLESRRRVAEDDAEALRLQLAHLRTQLQDRTAGLQAENASLAARLAGLEEFQRQKERLTSNMESLEKQLASREEQHRAALHSLEMKALLEKKRLEEEMETHVASLAAEVQHLVDQKVPETTRSALQENTEVKARLGLLSQQTLSLMGENSSLRDRKTRLGVDVDILEQMLKETSRQSCVRKKVVEQLTEKCRQLQAELTGRRRELEQLQAEHAGVLAETEALRRDRAPDSRAAPSRLEAELQEERRRSSRMKSVMQGAAAALRRALMDAPSAQEAEHSAARWKLLMEKLLVVLDSTAERDQLDEPLTSDPWAASGDPARGLRFQLARYRPGDLGFVPRPAPKHRPVVCRAGAAGSAELKKKPSSSVKQADAAVGLQTCGKLLTRPQ